MKEQLKNLSYYGFEYGFRKVEQSNHLCNKCKDYIDINGLTHEEMIGNPYDLLCEDCNKLTNELVENQLFSSLNLELEESSKTIESLEKEKDKLKKYVNSLKEQE